MKKLLGIYLKEETAKQIKHFAVENNSSVSAIIEKLVNDFLASNTMVGGELISSQYHNRAGNKFTGVELQILALITKGLSNKEIAQNLFLSESSIKANMHKIFNKSGCKNRTQLAIFGLNYLIS